MFNLTKQERMVVLFFAGVIFVGSLLQVIYKTSPGLRHFLAFTDRIRNYSRVDLNTADATALEKVPYVGKTTALAIVNARGEKGNFKSVDDLRKVKGIGQRKFELIKPFVQVKVGQP